MRESRTREFETATRWGVVAIAMLAAVIAAGHVGKLPLALLIRTEFSLHIVAAGWALLVRRQKNPVAG